MINKQKAQKLANSGVQIEHNINPTNLGTLIWKIEAHISYAARRGAHRAEFIATKDDLKILNQAVKCFVENDFNIDVIEKDNQAVLQISWN